MVGAVFRLDEVDRLPNGPTYASKFEWIAVDPGASFRWHVHDYPCAIAQWNHHPECEIHLIRNTSGISFVGDHIGEFAPGYIAMVGPDLPHNWVPNLAPGTIARNDHVVLQFHHERFVDAAALLPELELLEDLVGRAGRGLEFHGEAARTAARVMEAVGTCDGLARLTRFFELLDILGNATDYTVLSSQDYVPDLEPNVQDAIRQVMDYVSDNITGEVRMARAASLVGMSEPTFSRFFKRNIGCTFVEYVRKLRIAQACKLLADTSRPITDICFDVGFGNISNFNRRFLAEKGMPPSRYRRLLVHATRPDEQDLRA